MNSVNFNGSSGQKVEMWRQEFILVAKRCEDVGSEFILVAPDLLPCLDRVCWQGADAGVPASTGSSIAKAEAEPLRRSTSGQFLSGVDYVSSAISRGPIVVWKERDLVLAIRAYRRGGLAQHFLKEKFFQWPCLSSSVLGKGLAKFGATRAYRELEILSYLNSYGVSVPAPRGARVVFDRYGFYMAWIATDFVPDSLSLWDFAHKNEEREVELLPLAVRVGQEARRMLDLEVFHSDFHPGNVLVGSDGKVVLLDFDKALRFSGARNKEKYTKRLLARWARAVSKYQLSFEMVNGVKEGLIG